MRTAPEYAPYPLAQAPNYRRWSVVGGVLLVVSLGSLRFLHDNSASISADNHNEWRWGVLGLMLVSAIWLLAFISRVVYYRLGWHTGRWYLEEVEQIQNAWWAHHRQSIALIDAVLLGPSCTTRQHVHQLFSPDHQPPAPEPTPEGAMIRLPHVSGADPVAREHQLARLLALQWDEQRDKTVLLQPLRCYWQGSASAWQVFVAQMTQCCPQVQLPDTPEPWQGLNSLDTIIDQLQGAPDEIRVLCAGCQSTTPGKDRLLPAGEAAVLWWLGPQGDVRLSRAEWFTAEQDDLATVAQRALRQSALEEAPSACVRFSQPDIAGLPLDGWSPRPLLQDAHFGALENLEFMLVLTLAAGYAEKHGEPCAWLARDPYHTLVLGVVQADESSR